MTHRTEPQPVLAESTEIAPYRPAGASFGLWMTRQPWGEDEKAMAPGHAIRVTAIERGANPHPLWVDEVVYPQRRSDGHSGSSNCISKQAMHLILS